MRLCRLFPLILAAALSAQGPERIPAAGLRADARLLQQAFETLHPGLRRYLDPNQERVAFQELDDAFRQDRTLGEAFLSFSRLTAKIRCGHTFLNPSNQSKAAQVALMQGPRLPFQFRWVEGRMIVTRSLAAEPNLATGTEVLALDGVPAAKILEALLPYSRSDGHNDAKRIANLEVQGEERVEAFDLFYRLLFPKSEARFTLDLRTPEGKRALVTVPPLQNGVSDVLGGKDPDETQPVWTLQWLDARTALLRMPTWAVYNRKRDWKADLQKAMEELTSKGAKALVVDLRGNEGGLDVGNDILSHLIDTDLALPGLQRWTRYQSVPQPLRPNLDTWDRSFFEWGESAKPLGNGFYRLTRYDDSLQGDVIHPCLPRFNGHLAVLVDASNSSATFQFAQVVQRLSMGVLVGRPTGGNQRGINGGAFFFLRLPNSGLEVDLPLIGRFPSDGHPERLPDAGLKPDIPVAFNAGDLISGRDADLISACAALSSDKDGAVLHH